ncbi:MAG: DNA internalization-related competence protein ComEC/Rec2 [Magnetococcales bacterium]|nr:DNA internalization-related competence protein ComEC/Rec2 [Magnetococcales bacterium]
MPVLVAAIVAGIVAVALVAGRLPLMVGVLSVATVALLSWRRLQDGQQRQPWVDRRCRLWMTLGLGVAMGAGSASYHDRVLAQQQLPPAAIEGVDQWLEGTVIDREQRSDSLRLWLGDCRIINQNGGQNWGTPAENRVLLSLYQQTTTALPGERIRVWVRLKAPAGYRVPGAFDYALFLRRQGVVATAYARSAIERLPSSSPLSQQAFWNRWRVAIAQAITDSMPDHGLRAGLTEAVLVGYRGRIDGEVRDAFQAAGTFHLIAISGVQLTLAGAGFFYVIRLLLALCIPVSRRWNVKPLAAALAFIPLMIYAALAGWSIATQRAVVMAVLLLLAMVTGRLQQSWYALGLAAIVLLLYQPWELFEAGFQLSFAATAVLIWSGSWFARPRQSLAVRWLLGPVVTTTLAWLVTLPIVLHHFHFLSPWSVLANLVAVPLAGPVSVSISLVALLVWPFSDTVSALLFSGVGQLMELVWRWSAWIATLPGSWSRWPGPTTIGLAWLMVAGVFIMAARSGRGRWAGVLLAGVGYYWPHPTPAAAGQLHAALLDVGQAQAAVIRTPGGNWSVIDAGGVHNDRFNIGEVISSYLWYYGVTRLERLIISHADADHAAGGERLLRNFVVARIWTGGGGPTQPLERLLDRAQQQQVAVQHWSEAYQEQEGETVIRLLPPLPYTGGTRRHDNDHSLVVEVTLRQHRILFPSDLEKRGEQWLLAQQALQPVTVLVAPHHGSRSSSSMAFVETTQPQHVLFSVGAGNRYHFPAAEVVARWRQVAKSIWRTDHHGSLAINTDGHGLVAISPATQSKRAP